MRIIFQNAARSYRNWLAPRPSWCPTFAHAAVTVAGLVGFAPNLQGAEFIAQNNASVSGEVIRFTRNTVTIRPNVGSMIILSRSDIKLVRYELNDGSFIEGRLHGWDEGVYVIEVGDELVRAEAGTISPEPTTARPFQPNDEEAKETPNVELQDHPPPAATTGDGPPRVSVSTEVTSEAASTLIFNIRLSKRADSEIALVYATVDGSAKAGADYEAQSGVLVLPVGTSSARLETPLIDDDKPEDDESFSLFLSAAPAVATITSRRISATISDDDG